MLALFDYDQTIGLGSQAKFLVHTTPSPTRNRFFDRQVMRILSDSDGMNMHSINLGLYEVLPPPL